MELAPVTLFTYNRLQHTKDLIESLSLNEQSAESDLIVFSDGWKDEVDKKQVMEVRDYLKTITCFKSIKIIESPQNKGLANSIITGVTDVVNKYGKIIVLEDDLIVSPFFLKFMNDALITYQDKPKIGHIQAYTFTSDPSLPDTFLIKWTGSWGWATWSRAWTHFNPNGSELLHTLKERHLTKTFDFEGNYPFTKMLRKQVTGLNDSWAIRWNASLFLSDILSLNVSKSLVMNNGFDGSGTNCGGGDLYQSQLWNKPLPVIPISPIVENMKARIAFTKYYHQTNCFMAKAIRRIKRTLKGDFKA